MIRKRIPETDDRLIYTLIREQLFPFARRTNPKLTFRALEVGKRLKRGTTFVLENAPRSPAGFIHLLTKKDQLWVDMLAVDPKVQGRGLGSSLLAHAEAYGRNQGCTDIYLFVDKENSRALSFYRKHGYISMHYESAIDCYVYGKSLFA